MKKVKLYLPNFDIDLALSIGAHELKITINPEATMSKLLVFVFNPKLPLGCTQKFLQISEIYLIYAIR